MGSAPTVYDVAAAAGVSTATVSRYFRDPEKVSASTREAIAQTVQSLGYVPSGLARGLAERQTGSIGLYSFGGHEDDEYLRASRPSGSEVEVVDERSERVRLYPLFADEVLRGVELECTVRKTPLTVGWQSLDAGGIALDDLARRVDGVILLPHVMSDEMLQLLARTKPMVMVSEAARAGLQVGSVTVDNRAGMRALVSHLITVHGHRRLEFVGRPTVALDYRERRLGFEDALRDAGLPIPEITRVSASGRTGTRDAFVEEARDKPLPDAFVCVSDQTALGVMEALHPLGLRAPDDVAVTGFDGILAGRLTTPSLTTVRQPMEELGRTAVDLLTEQISGGEARHITLPVHLALRSSCGC
ncbi:MAG: LacI family DNA-binding transcriptional regulator [Microbacterium enclense]